MILESIEKQRQEKTAGDFVLGDTDDLTVARLAARAYMSEVTFRKYFQRLYSTSRFQKDIKS